MCEAGFEEVKPFVAGAGAVLCRTEHGNLHAGVVYLHGSAVSVLHLGWEDSLSRAWKWPRFWAAPDVEPERLSVVAGLCRLIWARFQKTKRFPYGLKFNASFDADGRLQLREGRGLTCATFVLAVFASAGITVVNERDWPVRKDDDEAFLRDAERFASSELLAALREEIAKGCQRFRPEEVLGAFACVIPAEFVAARTAADRLVGRLDAR